MLGDDLDLEVRGHRADVGVAVRVDLLLDAFDLVDQRPLEALVDGVLHVDALDRGARLPGGGQRPPGGAGGGAADVDVVEDDHRVLAAELELDRDQLLGGARQDLGARCLVLPVKKILSGF